MIVTLEEAKDILNVTTPTGSPLDQVDRTIEGLLEGIEAVVLAYANAPSGSPDGGRDQAIKLAIKIMLVELFNLDPSAPAPQTLDAGLSTIVANLLRRFHVPVIA